VCPGLAIELTVPSNRFWYASHGCSVVMKQCSTPHRRSSSKMTGVIAFASQMLLLTT
jgi:hypothetical protein